MSAPNSSLWRHRRFMLLWAAMLVSTSGSFLLLIALSTETFTKTKSGLLAGMIFASHWMLPIGLAPLVTYLNRTVAPARLLLTAELASAVLSLLVALTVLEHFAVTLALLTVRGLFEAITKTARSVALKYYVEEELLPQATGLFNTSFLLGTGTGALLGSLLFGKVSMLGIIMVNVACFLVAAGAYALLPALRQSQAVPKFGEAWRAMGTGWGTWASGWPELIKHGLLRPFLIMCASVGVFQAYHNVARTALPMGIFGGTSVDVTYFQIAYCLGLVAGAWIVSINLVKQRGLLGSETAWLAVTAVAVVIPVIVPNIRWSIGAYLVFAVAFEIAFTLAQTRIMTGCPKEAMAVVASFQHPLMLASMVAGVLGFGKLSDFVGVAGSAAAAAILSTVVVTFTLIYAKRSRAGINGGAEPSAQQPTKG